MFSYLLLKGAGAVIRLIPASAARLIGKLLGGAVFYLDRRHRRIALDNLRGAFGESKSDKEIRSIARDSFSQLGFNLVEFLRVPVINSKDWRSIFRVEGADRVREAFRRGRGIIFVLAHFGNWEYLGFSPRLLGFRGAAVGQDIKNPAVDGLVKDTREAIGLELLPKFEVSTPILTYLKNNGAVAILADQRARKMNIEADFFGRPAATTAAPAVFALKSGAALIPAFIYHQKESGYRIIFEPEIEIPSGLRLREAVARVTEGINAVIEARIREEPRMWLWGHRRWRPAG